MLNSRYLDDDVVEGRRERAKLRIVKAPRHQNMVFGATLCLLNLHSPIAAGIVRSLLVGGLHMFTSGGGGDSVVLAR